MIVVVFIDVVARYGFDSDSITIQEMEWHLFAVVFLLGATITMRENANVRRDAFYGKMPPLVARPSSYYGYYIFLSFHVLPDYRERLRPYGLFVSNIGSVGGLLHYRFLSSSIPYRFCQSGRFVFLLSISIILLMILLDKAK